MILVQKRLDTRKDVLTEGAQAELAKVFLEKTLTGRHPAELHHPLPHFIDADKIDPYVSDLAIADMIRGPHRRIVEYYILSERLPECHRLPVYFIHKPPITVLFHSLSKS